MSYIGKNPKVDSVKLTGASTAASGTEEGQLYYNTGTGSISKGLKVFKNSQFVSIDKQLGDSDTFHLLKAADISTAEWSAARNSTSTSFLNQNSVPFETTTASGVAGTFSNSSTNDALLTDESADLVFAYKSSGTSDDAQEYFGIPLTVPKAFRGGNVVLSFEYRTGFGTGTTATVDGDFEVGILDKSSGNGGQTTSTNSTTDIAAGSAITVASKTGLAVGQRIRLEAGSQAAIGSPDATVVEAYITEVSGTANEIKISEAWDTPHASGAVVVSGWLTDVVPGQLPAADSQTNKQGKKYSIQFKTEDDTSDIVLFFQNKNTSSTISRHLFVDNILLSANKFLQASSQLKSEYYYASGNSNFWNDLNSNSGWDADLIVSGFGAPTVAQSKFLRFEETSTTDTRVYAKQDIDLAFSFTGHAQAGNQIKLYNSSGEILAQQQTPDPAGHVQNNSISIEVALAKDDYVYCVNDRGSTASNRYGAASFVAKARNSDIVVLESQDEIFTDWNEFTMTPTSGTAVTKGTIVVDRAYWRRVGPNMEIMWDYKQSTTGGSGTGVTNFPLPSGYVADTDKVFASSTNFLANVGHVKAGFSATNGIGIYSANGMVCLLDSTNLGFFFPGAYNNMTQQSATNFGFGGEAHLGFTMRVSIPIKGFNANFNPLLSMPLVEIGGNVEYYYGNVWTGRAGNSLYSTQAATANTINNLGTITNSSTEGFFFTASQRCKVAFGYLMQSTGTPDVGIGGGSSTLDFYNNAISSTHFDGYRLANLSAQTSTANETVTAETVLEPGQKIGIAWSDSTSGVSTGNSAGGVSIVATKDFSNTNMAHIIKPSIARITYETARNANSGGSTGHAAGWTVRPLTTLTGEAYFVSINTSTDTFTLDPGMYQIRWKANGFSCEAFQTRLELDSAAYKYGSLNYSVSTGMATDSSYGDVTTTVTSSTQTWRLTQLNSHNNTTNGFGNGQNTWDAIQIHSEIVIEKLK